MARFGHTELPQEIQTALRRAVRLAWFTIAFFATGITVLVLTMGESQAMRTAVVENALSFIPPIAFLIAVRATKHRPSERHPYGYHRAVGVGHLVAATALLGLGAFLLVESALALATGSRSPVGLVEIAGHQTWAGWLMIAALAYTAVPPVLLGRAKMPLAEQLHDRVLFADAEMNSADWWTAVGAIAGILGLGLGLWWADTAAALFISGSIVRDGVRNLRVAVAALMDARVETYDGTGPHPLLPAIDDTLAELDWVEAARSRTRDQGHVFHIESFVVPRPGHTPSLADLREAREAVIDLDWKTDDVVIVPVEDLPERILPGVDDERPRGQYDATT